MNIPSLLAQIPEPPAGSVFHPQSVREVDVPHAYQLTPRHRRMIEELHGGRYSLDTLLDVEDRGLSCGKKGCLLCYKQHKTLTVLFIRVPRRIEADVQEISGLWEYMRQVQHRCILLGINKFTFPFTDDEEPSLVEVFHDVPVVRGERRRK